MTEPTGPTPTELVDAAEARRAAARAAGDFPGPAGARPVEDRDLPDDRDLLTALGSVEHHTIAVTGAELASLLRRRRAVRYPAVWSTGGPANRTLYEGDRFVGSTVDPADATRIADRMNRATPVPTDG